MLGLGRLVCNPSRSSSPVFYPLFFNIQQAVTGQHFNTHVTKTGSSGIFYYVERSDGLCNDDGESERRKQLVNNASGGNTRYGNNTGLPALRHALVRMNMVSLPG